MYLVNRDSAQDLVTVPAQWHGTVPAPPYGERLLSLEMCHDGSLLGLWATDSQADLEPRQWFPGGSIGLSTPREPTTVVATQQWGNAVNVIGTIQLTVAYPSLQLIPDGLLVVGSRCDYLPGAPEHNAAVFDFDGGLIRTGCLGDGIEIIRSTADGRVWAGYFDEGIFGNNGWIKPLGAAGVVLWSTDTFEKVWEPISVQITSTYAATLVGDDLWTSTYGGFPISHLSPASEHSYPTTDSFPKALITDGTLAATFGHTKYCEGRRSHDSYTFRVWELSDTVDHPRITGRFSIPEAPEDADPKLMGYGDELTIIAGQQWYKLSLRDILNAGRQ